MIFISAFEIISADMPDPKNFFWIAASVADAAAVNPNDAETLLVNNFCTFFINGKPAVINGLSKLRNPPSWIVTFFVVPFNKIYPFFKDLITFITIITLTP